ncbi:UV-endonuclease UvdE [Obba rivulosa]|uniref:UV-endonuclease UvdE n=1 Tax=Obba rivulosa TaxID=1052685 RepID=A0A8E2DNK7_9APHY|nr:UV-endonuclease UvdE [Obba rivulosa]
MPSKRKHSALAQVEENVNVAEIASVLLSPVPPTLSENPQETSVERKISKRAKNRRAAAVAVADDTTVSPDTGLDSPLTELELDTPILTKKKRRAKAKDIPEAAADGDVVIASKRKRRTKAEGFSSAPEIDSEALASPRKRRTKANEPVVYDIPPVETRETDFKGRLGYACLNTLLRASKPESVFCSRTCRIDTILKHGFTAGRDGGEGMGEGMDYVKELGRKNAANLMEIIEWNEKNHIRFFRLSSEMFPFSSHAKYGYSLKYAREELKAAGDLARKYGHRLTTHPGQFTQLGSPKDDVVEASIRELDYHCEMMRYMELGKDSVIILHMGGVYGSKEDTIARFRGVYTTRLTDEMRARLVLENDEICYSADDLLPVCEELGIPIVLDYHHNWINPSTLPIPELISRIKVIWSRKGIKPKQHLSDPRPGAETVMEKRAHADRCKALPDDLPIDMDLMIEAKDKEQAVFQLYRVYRLAPVAHENLRPEKPPKPFERSRSRTTLEPGHGEDIGGMVSSYCESPDPGADSCGSQR